MLTKLKFVHTPNMQVKLCRDCRFSSLDFPHEPQHAQTRCSNEKVVYSYYYTNPDLLSAPYGSIRGTIPAYKERERRFFAPCGRKGKLWEQR